MRTRGRLTDPAQFRDIVVRSTPGGPQVRLGDVARIELGGESYSTAASLNNQPAVMLLVYQQSDANGIGDFGCVPRRDRRAVAIVSTRPRVRLSV